MFFMPGNFPALKSWEVSRPLNYLQSVRINGNTAFVAPLRAPEKFIAAAGA